jgi:uncharacterized tellurite resistance protein B-like protein
MTVTTRDGHVHFGDRTRQAALFETMILAAASDGSVSRIEVEEIYRRVFERPEFRGIHAGDLREAIAHAAQKVAGAKVVDEILPSIAERLPDRQSRELAFGLAASVVTADQRTPASELRFLKALQREFGLSEDDVARLFELAEFKAPLPPTRAR